MPEDIKKNNETEEEDFLDDFIEEAKEHIEMIEMNVLTLEREPENKDIINAVFRCFHTIKGLSGFVSQDNIREISHKVENVLVKIRKGELKVNRDIIDMILQSVDFIKRICNDIEINNKDDFLKEIGDFLENISKDDYKKEEKKIGEILKEEKIITEEELENAVKKQAEEYKDMKIGEIILKEGNATAQEIVNSLRVQEEDTKKGNDNSEYIKIPVKRIDDIINYIGEIMIIHSQLAQEYSAIGNTNIESNAKYMRLSKLIKEVQNNSMTLRMVSLKSTFQKINRIARDTLKEVNKKVNISIIGEETEIDRNIADKILEPMLHVIKNAISHGIEDEETRQKKSKPKEGNIKIEAYSKRGTVYIIISDDGKGLDIEKIYSKALEKELIGRDKKYSETEIIEFIFLPGFSTADKVDNVSGRGVGMDIVKTEIMKTGGKVEIISEKDKGTEITLKIPINLAAINGTIVKIGKNNYIIPTIYIKEIIKNEEKYNINVKGKKAMLKVRDKIIPLISGDKIFGSEYNEDDKAIIIVLELEENFKAIKVDDIIGRKEIVVKPLDEEFSDIKFISGASILGDGKVCLILDIENIFKIS